MKHYRITTNGDHFRVEVATDRWWRQKLKWEPALYGIFENDIFYSGYEAAVDALDRTLRQETQSWRLPDSDAPPPCYAPNPGCVDGCIRHL